ncbi:MBL fold metallo-hydrolase [Bacillus sp. B15-48]|uniref:MBL fold metallo-hydrolase n=1 Tax=Bacillus sp. B15-48 TaxID=1548601 RepID=UPI00193FA1F9|nr:MBL fold metallo-hydrolase [Bacillus sp. B15-48]
MGSENVKLKKITLPTPYAISEVNVYIIWGEALTIIDTGVKTEESKAALTIGLKEWGLKIADIEQVILTHHHIDHAGGLDFFTKDIPVYGHENNQRWLGIKDEFLTSHHQFILDLSTELGVPEPLKENFFMMTQQYVKHGCERKLHKYLAEGDELPGLPDWQIIETFGHAQSHLSFYHQKSGVMIGGDHLLVKMKTNPIMEPPIENKQNRPKPLLQYIHSLQKWLNVPISKLYTGHGQEVTDVHTLIDKRLSSLNNKAMQVKELLSQKPSTGYEICQQLFPKMKLGFNYKLWETVGYLDFLEEFGEIKKNTYPEASIYSMDK